MVVLVQNAEIADTPAAFLNDLHRQRGELLLGQPPLMLVVPAPDLLDIRLQGCTSEFEEELTITGLRGS